MSIIVITPSADRIKEISDEIGVSLAALSIAFRNMAADTLAAAATDVRNGHEFDPDEAQHLTALAEVTDDAWKEYEADPDEDD